MKIAHVRADAINAPVDFRIAGVRRESQRAACRFGIGTDSGGPGHGPAWIAVEEAIGAIVAGIVAPA